MTRVAAALQAIGSVVREAADMRDPVQSEHATPMSSSGKVRARMVGAMYGVREKSAHRRRRCGDSRRGAVPMQPSAEA